MGVLSVGVYLPEVVRTNEWWPTDMVEAWERRVLTQVVRQDLQTEDPRSECAQAMANAMASVKGDPFQGAKRRHVMPEGMMSSDMELAAAEDALRKAGIQRSDVDVLLVSSALPDNLNVSNACVLHQRLGLPDRCLTTSIDAMCNSFLMQLSLVEKLISARLAKYAVLVQSAAMSRISRPEDQFSVWTGDGATAVVVGPVSAGRGVLGRAHRTDGSVFGGIVTGVPGKNWWEGPPIVYIQDSRKARRMFLSIGDFCGPAMREALDQASLTTDDISFYASHQATVWFQKVTQRALGLDRAKNVSTFPDFGNMLGCNIPLNLHEGASRGLLRDGEVVAMMSGAAGMATSCAVLRWGV
ncbi:MAG: hypothetical protein JNG84_13785 [Archangium sp.]|nr:hypothetical protein [Archangium sp.]